MLLMFKNSSEGCLGLDFLFFLIMLADASDLPWVFSFFIVLVGICDTEAWWLSLLLARLMPIAF